MIEINLLPKDLQKKRFGFKLDKNIMLAISACLALIAVMAAYSFIFQAGKYANLEKQLAISKAETEKYAPEIAKIEEIGKKKDQILSRMSAIQQLDRNREYWVTLMEDMAGRVPEYVWLTNVKQAPAVVQAAAQPGQAAPAPAQATTSVKSTLEGYSFSLNALATFLVRLKKSDFYDNIEIASIKLQDIEKAKAYNFKLNCDLVSSLPVSLDAQTAQIDDMLPVHY
jgi:Tfp pilus assembly protein PilN